jgi:hypothetical protein
MVFAMMLTLEGIARFVQELLRVEPPVTFVHGYGLSLSMVLGMFLAGTGMLLAWVFNRMGGDSHKEGLGLAAA